jgi:predicted Zn-dependent protease
MKLRYTWRKTWLAPGIAVALLALPGCQTAVEPITGRKQFILTDARTEMRMGLDAWNEIIAQEKPSQDRQKTAALKRVGNALSKAIDQPGFEWEFQTFQSEDANAFCLPGGKVGVYEGLFNFIANDAELAAVVGHEIGHAVARHGGERMTQSILQNLGALGLSVALGSAAEEERVRWMAAYVGVTTVGVILPYSRTHEYAADELGMVYMARAGYDPAAAVSFWEKFSQESKTPGILEFISTHPVGSKRLGRLREILPRAQLEYDAAGVKYGLGQVYSE